MTPVILFSLAIGAAAAAILATGFMVFARQPEAAVEDRLSALTNNRKGNSDKAIKDASMLMSSPLGETQEMIEDFVNRHLNLQRSLDQAALKIKLSQFLMIVGGTSVGLSVLAIVAGLSIFIVPFLFILPIICAKSFLSFRRKRRINKFVKQLPEALDLLGRSLRSGHSLGAGFGLIASEMPDPISSEFGRCFEEQNLGIQLDEALKNMTVRIPNMDLRFMVTSIVLQRQTGGDLVEILEKISKLIRERFKLAGQINALTGEGRLSGIVLFMLPPGLFVSTYFLNREYVMSLFSEDIGKKMVAGAIVMQLIGAYVIRKIVDIKV